MSNSLASVHPELIPEWSERNLPLTPDIRLKNSLIAQGRYTDGVDDVLCKVLSAKKRKVKIKYF